MQTSGTPQAARWSEMAVSRALAALIPTAVTVSDRTDAADHPAEPGSSPKLRCRGLITRRTTFGWPVGKSWVWSLPAGDDWPGYAQYPTFGSWHCSTHLSISMCIAVMHRIASCRVICLTGGHQGGYPSPGFQFDAKSTA